MTQENGPTAFIKLIFFLEFGHVSLSANKQKTVSVIFITFKYSMRS